MGHGIFCDITNNKIIVCLPGTVNKEYHHAIHMIKLDLNKQITYIRDVNGFSFSDEEISEGG